MVLQTRQKCLQKKNSNTKSLNQNKILAIEANRKGKNTSILSSKGIQSIGYPCTIFAYNLNNIKFEYN